ncbi:response regulator [uncultured Methylobacterium sp.]|uniref:response regulator n=1 Tax=uncultured Methylobacterium sp. TaxID=157278 RepID=UPI00262CAE61|nr:response regulator [uncultured Methylobacterium sp.]
MPSEDPAKRPAVLLLEDDPLLAMSLSDYIEEAGGEVVEARTTAKAISILEERTDIRIVVADLDTRGSVMGLKLAAMIRDRWPPIELILTSSAPRPPRAAEMPARGVYLSKPFDSRAMVSTIREFMQHH